MDDLTVLSGVGKETVKKLDENGLSGFMQIAVSSPTEISLLCGLTEKKARIIIKESREKVSLSFQVAREYAKKRDKINKIGTGCSNFDNVIGGGFEPGVITEVYGRFGSGKTQLCHLMVVRTLKEDKKNKAIILDSEGTFRASRIKDFCKTNGLDYNDAMNRIYISRSFNSSHQMILVDEIEKIVQKDNTYKILIVDSLTSHFRSDYIGRGTLAKRQQLLNKHLHQLLKMADIYNLIVIVSNQVVSDPGIMYGNPEKPIGGNIVGHMCTIRLYLRPAKSGTWAVKLIDSPDLPQAETRYLITTEGFINVK